MKHKKEYLNIYFYTGCILCLCSFILFSCKKDDEEIDPKQYAGTWEGVTSDNKSISFTVHDNGTITNLRTYLKLFLAGDPCGLENEFVNRNSISIDNNEFSGTLFFYASQTTGPLLEGKFTSSDKVSGQVDYFSDVVNEITIICGGTIISGTGTWSIATGSCTWEASRAGYTQIEIQSPGGGSILSDVVTISVTSTNIEMMENVEFYIDDELINTDNTSPFSYQWDTREFENGGHTLEVKGYDVHNRVTSDAINVNISNPKWKLNIGSPYATSLSLGFDGTIYLSKRGNINYHKLLAIDIDGILKWEFPVEGFIGKTPIVGPDDRIYIATDLDKIYVINPDGSFNSEFTGSYDCAISSDGTIYLDSSNVLYALNPDRSVKWTYQTENRFASSPIISSDGTIYIGIDDSTNTDALSLLAINSNGTEKWKFTDDYLRILPLAIDSEGTIFIPSWDLYALNSDGTIKWCFELDGGYVTNSPVIDIDGTIYIAYKLYIPVDYFALCAINPDGTVKWEFEVDDLIESTPAISSDGIIYFGSYDYTLYGINRNGIKETEFKTEGRIKESPAIGPDGTIYIYSDDEYLYAISGTEGLADSPWPMYFHDNQHTGSQE